MKLTEQTIEIVKETTGSVLSEACFDKALRLAQDSTISYFRGEYRVVIPASDGSYYRFTVDAHCPCKAGQHDRICSHAITRDLLYVQQLRNEREAAEQRHIGQQREAERRIERSAAGLEPIFS
jgi:uncharacterized protein YjhX (UPF0386 family)